MTDLLLYEQSHPDPAIDTALSALLAERVGSGGHDPAVRLGRPGRVLAFGKADRVVPGYADALAAARSTGFEPVERLAGGRAAVFHEASLSFSIAMPVDDPRLGIVDRFTLIAGLTVDALRRLGVEADVGELPGEYCPGAYSVHADGRLKVAGFGQRLVRGAAHVGGVVVAGRSDLVRDALVPVYAALDLSWDPTTAGAVDDVVAATTDDVQIALLGALSDHFQLTPAEIPAELWEEATDRADRHRPRTR